VWQTVLGAVVGVACLLVLGVVVGLAVPSARAAQAVGLLAFFPVYLLGGGGAPRGVMRGPMQAVASALPSPILAVTDPWLGSERFSGQLVALGAWLVCGLVAAGWLAGRR
jgi:ABC-2 type transport system permease protein